MIRTQRHSRFVLMLSLIHISFASHFLNAQELSELIHLHGVDKVFFATDCPWSTVPAEKALLEAADLTPAQRERIACRNAEELFGITV